MFDIVIHGGRIVDGTGNPWHYGDVGIRGAQINAIGKINNGNARRTIDATGQVICPGFIDMHSHSDVMILANPKHEAKIMQGVTTDLIGLDGMSYAPLSPNDLQMVRRYLSAPNGNPDINWDWSSVAEFLNQFDRRVAANVAYLVPHNSLRLGTIGFVDRPVTNEELKNMQAILVQGMLEGAVGFSTALDYFPARYSNTGELIEICKSVAEYGGISVWHTRRRDLGLIGAIKEVLKVVEVSGVKAHFSHFAAAGKANRGKSTEMLTIVDEARDRGLDITFDSYPYVASSSALTSFLPRWVHEGGPDAIMRKLGDANTKSRIATDIDIAKPAWDRIVLACVSSDKNRVYIGKSILEAADLAGKDPAHFACDLLYEEQLSADIVNFQGNEEDVRNIMRHSCHTASSDGHLIGDRPNPRAWGSFARYLGVYSRELRLLSLEEMIRHMTSAAAQCLGLDDRGLVKQNLAADLVVFDPQKVIDRATFEKPKEYPDGVSYVLVNGEIVVDRGKHTGILNGRAILKV